MRSPAAFPGVALVAVRLDPSCDAWTSAMVDGLRREAAQHGLRVRVWPPAAAAPCAARPGPPTDGEEAASDPLEGVEAVFCWDPHPGLLASLLPRGRLRLVASMGAGFDHMADECRLLRAGGGAEAQAVRFCRTVDPRAAARLAEWVLCAVLNLTRRTEDFMALQAQRQWNAPGGGLACRDAHETSVGVLGLGEMGAAAAAMLARHGFQVSGWRRTARGGGSALEAAGVRLFAGAEERAAFLSPLDVLVCVLPGGGGARGLVDKALLAGLPRGAAVVNCGRGECVSEPDLLEALDSGWISRATLDVAAEEPLPAASPLWNHPRVRLTPHVAGPSSSGAGCAQMVENWRRMRNGEALLHVIDDL